MANQSRKKPRVPRFKSLEEEAEFWDTHDLSEFEDEWEEVALEFARPLGHIFELETDARTLDRVFEAARAKGIGPSELIGQWIQEGLRQEEPAPARKKPRSA